MQILIDYFFFVNYRNELRKMDAIQRNKMLKMCKYKHESMKIKESQNTHFFLYCFLLF